MNIKELGSQQITHMVCFIFLYTSFIAINFSIYTPPHTHKYISLQIWFFNSIFI